MNQQQTATFDLADVVGLLWRRRLLVLGSSLLGFGVAAAFALALPRTFVAEGQVVVRAESSLVPDPDHSFYSSVVNQFVVTTERDVLAARGLMARVADSVPFPSDSDQSTWIGTALDNVVARLGIRAALDKLALRLGREPAESDPAQAERLAEAKRVNRISHALGTAADKGSSVIRLLGATNDAQFSAAIVNKALILYMADRLAAQQRSARNVEVALRERLEQTKAEISRAEERVATLMLQPGLLESSEIPSDARELTIIGTRLTQAQADLTARQAAYRVATRLRDTAHGDPAQLIEVLDQGSQSTSNLRRQFAELQAELNRVSAQVGPDHPRYAAVRQAMNGLVARLSGEAQRLIAQRQAEVASAEQVVTSLSKQYADIRKTRSQISPAVLNVDREREALVNLRRIAGSIEDRLIAVAAQPVDLNARILTWARSRLEPPTLKSRSWLPLASCSEWCSAVPLPSSASIGAALGPR